MCQICHWLTLLIISFLTILSSIKFIYIKPDFPIFKKSPKLIILNLVFALCPTYHYLISAIVQYQLTTFYIDLYGLPSHNSRAFFFFLMWSSVMSLNCRYLGGWGSISQKEFLQRGFYYFLNLACV